MGSPAESGWADAIVAQHYQGLYRYAYRLSGSATEAQDLTQETFVRAFSHRRQLRHVERVRPWLYSILRNEYLRRCRQQQQRGPTISLDDTDDLAERLPAPPTNIDAELLQQALLQLPEEFRTTPDLALLGRFPVPGDCGIDEYSHGHGDVADLASQTLAQTLPDQQKLNRFGCWRWPC
jgi:RNA polymerase sigma factor (sigma-70 family)